MGIKSNKIKNYIFEIKRKNDICKNPKSPNPAQLTLPIG